MARTNSRTNLYGASVQWAHRPEEERFWDLQELHNLLLSERSSEKEYDYSYANISLVGDDTNNLMLETKNGTQLALTNWSFTQLCNELGLAPSTVRSFTIPTIQAMMRERMVMMGNTRSDPIAEASEDDWEILDEDAVEAPSTNDGSVKLLVKKNGHYSVRAITSTSYGRKWNSDIVGMLREVAEPNGWRNPPARPAFANAKKVRIATEQDVLMNQSDGGGLNIKVGDTIGPAGLYANDRNMFIFLVDDSNPIDDGSEGGMKRGFYVSNSEVGERRTLNATFFGYKSICGNHIIWGASNVVNIKLKHTQKSVGRFDDKFAQAIGNYHNADKALESRLIQAAKLRVLGKTKDETVDEAYKLHSRFNVLTKDLLGAAYDAASQWEHTYNAAPNTVWGMVNGMSQISQVKTKFADIRNTIDRAAGSLMELVKPESVPVTTSVPVVIEGGIVVTESKSDGGNVPAKRGKKHAATQS